MQRDHLAWTIGNGDPLYPTQDTLRMRKTSVKKEEKADKNNNKGVVINLEKKETWAVDTKKKNLKQSLTIVLKT